MSAPGQEAGCGAPSKEASSRIRPSAASSPKSSPARSGCPVFQRVTQATRTTPSCTSGGPKATSAAGHTRRKSPMLAHRASVPVSVPWGATKTAFGTQAVASRRNRPESSSVFHARARLHHPSHCHGASLTDPKRLPAPSDSSTSAPGRTVRHSLLHREAVAVTPSGDLGDPILARVRTV